MIEGKTRGRKCWSKSKWVSLGACADLAPCPHSHDTRRSRRSGSTCLCEALGLVGDAHGLRHAGHVELALLPQRLGLHSTPAAPQLLRLLKLSWNPKSTFLSSAVALLTPLALAASLPL